MVIRPNSTVRLLSNIPTDATYQNVLQFDTVEEQTAYFMQDKFLVRSFDRFTYIDQTFTIRVPVNIEKLWNVNYLMYQNTAYGNKWFYAFVNRVEWTSDNSTDIIMSIDIWQTWQFSLRFNPSFIKRECVSDDDYDKNLIIENLDKGTYICDQNHWLIDEIGEQEEKPWLKNRYLFIYSSYGSQENNVDVKLSGTGPDGDFDLTYAIPNTVKASNGGEYINGLYSGSKITGIYELNIENEATINAKIQELTQKGQIESITAMYCGYGINYHMADNKENVTSFRVNVPRPVALDGYIPRNKKLYTQPFQYLILTNNEGSAREFGFEYGGDSDKTSFPFIVGASIVGRPILMAYPLNYNNSPGISYSITCDSFPLASYAYSAYQNQLGLNRVSNTIGAVNDFIDFGQAQITNAVDPKSILFPSKGITNAVNMGIDYAQDVASSIGSHIDMARAPMTTSGTTDPNFLYSRKLMGFSAQVMSIRHDYAKRIDDYFSMYGYEVDTVKDIELHSRRNWNYIKTINCNVEGNCPSSVLDTIRAIFDRGVTLWHTGDFNYRNLDNPIIV